jgi:hypothetical protein
VVVVLLIALSGTSTTASADDDPPYGCSSLALLQYNCFGVQAQSTQLSNCYMLEGLKNCDLSAQGVILWSTWLGTTPIASYEMTVLYTVQGGTPYDVSIGCVTSAQAGGGSLLSDQVPVSCTGYLWNIKPGLCVSVFPNLFANAEGQYRHDSSGSGTTVCN